jgi:hypothetical protein
MTRPILGDDNTRPTTRGTEDTSTCGHVAGKDLVDRTRPQAGLSIRLSQASYIGLMRKKPSESERSGESAVLGTRTFAAISAVEELKLTTHAGGAPIEQRRAAILRA